MQADLCHCCSQTSEDRFSSVGAHIMGCPPVCGDNPRALASGFSYVQGDKHDKLFHTTYMSVDYFIPPT